uniref:Uncharacterized protein n=1 Tax=Rhizophora mucronata TaxID=61149 RepID=A0A2P2IZL2_RHIMU
MCTDDCVGCLVFNFWVLVHLWFWVFLGENFGKRFRFDCVDCS